MSTAHFQHIKTSMVDEVAVVEVLPKELRFPPQARSLERSSPWSPAGVGEAAPGQHETHQVSQQHRVRRPVQPGEAIKDRGDEVKFCGIDPEVQIGAEIIGLDKVAEIHETEHEALKAFSSKA